MKFGAVEAIGAGTTALKSFNKLREGKDDGKDGDAQPSSFKRGGKVKKTGRAKVHKGETVLTRAQSRKYKRSKRGGKR